MQASAAYAANCLAESLRANLSDAGMTVWQQQTPASPLHAGSGPFGRHLRKFDAKCAAYPAGARAAYLLSLAMRCARRETLRLAVFLCTTLRCAARIITGSASLNAVIAVFRSPAAIASSTLRTDLRSKERRVLLTSVLRAILRVALRAELVLAMGLSLATGAGGWKVRQSDRSMQENAAAKKLAATGEAYSKAPYGRQRPSIM